MNRSKDLRDLFRQSLINERNRPKVNYVRKSPMYSEDTNFMGGVHRVPSQFGDGDVHIYFYEWSDPNKSPRVFYQLDAFDNFLRSCGIYMELYQKDIIRNLGTVYATCYTGTKRLNIRGSYNNLIDSLNENFVKQLLPTAQQFKSVFDPQSRWKESDGTFFG